VRLELLQERVFDVVSFDEKLICGEPKIWQLKAEQTKNAIKTTHFHVPGRNWWKITVAIISAISKTSVREVHSKTKSEKLDTFSHIFTDV
jgi:hypothetical protein